MQEPTELMDDLISGDITPLGAIGEVVKVILEAEGN